MVDQFEYLGKSVALVLGFVGGKLVAEYFGVEVSTMVSLAVVFSTLGAGIGASILLKPEDDQTEETRKSLKDLYAKNGQGDEE
jgi:predicted tellurium resistance membrane protein TerC